MDLEEKTIEYFKKHWKKEPVDWPYSGVDFISNLIKYSDTILDVGCGYNLFKERFPLVVGIDPAREEADYQVDIMDFHTRHRFDVILCLGSINFGTEELIRKQVDKVVSLAADECEIFWRCNPGRADHNNTFCHEVDFFPWSFSLLDELAYEHGFITTFQLLEKHPTTERERIFSRWERYK